MNWYPQIQSGSVAQFPVARNRQWRTIVSALENGERVALPDTSGGLITWLLAYTGLTDAEVANIGTLFGSSQGQFAPFAFVDPLANLLAWSETPANQSWQAGLLQIAGGITDPLGTQRASSITNGSAGPQALSQSLNIPGSYVTCFSAFVRSTAAAGVNIQRDGQQSNATAGTAWQRIFVSGTGTAGAQQSNFSLAIGPGQSIDVWGLQVEVQPYPSKYKLTQVALGIYEETYFAGDELTVTGTAPGLSACQIQLISRV